MTRTSPISTGFHEWTEQELSTLRRMWEDGDRTKDIAAALGFTKNAIVGKAHRLDLPSRPSPILLTGPNPEKLRLHRRPIPAGLSTLPPLTSTEVDMPKGLNDEQQAYLAERLATKVSTSTPRSEPVSRPNPPVKSAPSAPLGAGREAVPDYARMTRLSAASRANTKSYASPFDNLAHRPVKREPTPMPYRPSRECMWPIGDPGTPGFRFCDVPHTTGRSYCQQHCDIAYHRVRDRREDGQQGAAA